MIQDDKPSKESAALRWGWLSRFIEADRRLAQRASGNPVTLGLYEFLRFGIKQAWACLFGGAMLALLLASHLWYPKDASLARYDFLVLAALAVQVGMLVWRLETWEEARVILVFHLVGTVMEVFKTSMGSWIYPEPSVLRLGGVPLFTGFMYAAVGSYIARAWRLFDFRFERYPPEWATWLLAIAIYANFFLHHYWYDLRWIIFGVFLLLYGRTIIWFRVHHHWRWLPVPIATLLVALFIWFAENIGTWSRAWIYPSQSSAWSPVSITKLSAWYLLMIISVVLVTLVQKPKPFNKREDRGQS